jgi:acyl carrier protein
MGISLFINCFELWRIRVERHEKIRQMLFGVVDELNQLRAPDEYLAKDMETPLTGDAGKLDSAGLINLIAVTEQKTATELGRLILLTDDRTLSQVNQIFRTLGTLADYIQLRLNE